MCPAAPVTATLIGVFMAQLATNVSLSKAKANYLSCRAKWNGVGLKMWGRLLGPGLSRHSCCDEGLSGALARQSDPK